MSRLLAGFQLHEPAVGCGMMTQGELRQLLEESGFVDVRVADQPNPARFVLPGEKPGQ